VHFDWRIIPHTNIRKFKTLQFCSTSILQHGGVNCCKQNDVTVTPCIESVKNDCEKMPLNQLLQWCWDAAQSARAEPSPPRDNSGRWLISDHRFRAHDAIVSISTWLVVSRGCDGGPLQSPRQCDYAFTSCVRERERERVYFSQTNKQQ